MSDNRAYTYPIIPFGSGPDEDVGVNQSDPSWVLTVVSWLNRDSLRTNIQNSTTNDPVPITSTLEPLIIASDCIELSVDNSKSTLTPSFNAVLKLGDVNYLTAIAPGDFVFINMLNWETGTQNSSAPSSTDYLNAGASNELAVALVNNQATVFDLSTADQIIKKIQNGKPINGFNDGFKGVFKVQGVREVISVNPETGAKSVFCNVNGFAFTEFNNTIYYNPNVLDNDKGQQSLVFASQFQEVYNLLTTQGTNSVQNIITILTKTFIGNGPNSQNISNVITPSKNTQFLMPQIVGTLMNIPNVTSAKDIYTFIFGVQSYTGGAVATDPGTGLNPNGLQAKHGPNFLQTPTQCQGNGFLKAEYWNQVKAWAILNQYTNAPLNEFYTCFRTNPNGDVVPTVVFRQTPFTSEDFGLNTPTTRYMTLPRWYVHPALITNLDLGRDESARINFVQCYAQSTFDKGGTSVSFETAQGNFVYDIQDVKRSGLRPYVWSSTFDEVAGENPVYRSPTWAKIVGDCLIGGHLKMNGHITCIGIVEPIAVGDNLELGGIVYHIEQISHNCSISEDGKKQFRTTLALSSGLSTLSTKVGTSYAEMDFTNAQEEREWDFEHILPGIAAAQSGPLRTNVDQPNDPEQNTTFAQPNKKEYFKPRRIINNDFNNG